MNVLVTGGAGFIGSHAVKNLLKQGHQVSVLDDLSRGYRKALLSDAEFCQASIDDTSKVRDFLRQKKIDLVMHFAAFVDVAESARMPDLYLETNYRKTLKLLDAMKEEGVSRFIFSSTAAVYGNPEELPITESHPKNFINAYGESKSLVEDELPRRRKSDGLSYAIFRYFNVAGTDPEGRLGEDHVPRTHLIPSLLEVARGEREEAKIFGTDYDTRDGTCIRDYIHVEDIVGAHILAMNKLDADYGEIFNLGNERGFTVKEMIEATKKVTGKDFKVTEAPRREGDSALLVASSKKAAEELGWKPQYPDVESMIEHNWKWMLENPKGYH